LLFLTHVGFMLVVNEFDNGEPRVTVVDVVTKSRGVNDCELDLELTFLKLSLDNFDFSKLVELLVVASVVFFAADSSVEKSVFMRVVFPRPDSPTTMMVK